MHVYEGSLQPAPFLVENAALLPTGRALDVAMGNGRNSIYLARLGFEVEGVDISAQAVQEALQSARRLGVSINAHEADLENGYSLNPGSYDVIICFHYLHRPLVPQIKTGLRRQGGIVVYETFLVDQAQCGRPKNPDYLLRHNELLFMFSGFRCLRYREGIIETKDDKRALAGIVAQKL